MNRFQLVKILLSALAIVTALCAVGPTAASAFVSGHFVSEAKAHETTLIGVESGAERTELNVGGLAYQCEETSYHGKVVGTTVQQVTISPFYKKCTRTEGGGEKVEVNGNGCYFNVRTGREEEHNTAEMTCPPGKKIEITSSSCNMKISPQTWGVLEYTTVTESGKHAITADVTAKKIIMELHGGFCVFLPTNFTEGELTGSVQVNGFSPEGEPVGITATDGPAPPKFRSEVSHTSLTGSQSAENVYTLGILVGSIKCTTTTVSGTMAVQATDEITLSPTYSGCKGLEREVTVDMNGCAYLLKAFSGSQTSFTIECPAGKSIETTVDTFPEGCTLTIGAQAANNHVDVKTEGSGTSRDVLLTWTLEKLKYKRDGCEVGGEASNGTYSGSVTLKGQSTSEEQKGLWFGS